MILLMAAKMMNPFKLAKNNRIIFLLSLVLIGVWSTASAASLSPGDEYVALGSSFASGPGIAKTLDEGCARSSNNYAQLVARALDLSLVDVSCSGATIANVMDTAQHNQGGDTVAPQILALSENTKLVTVTVGGNSFHYAIRTIQSACDATGLFSRALNKSVLCFMVGQMDTEGSQQALAQIEVELAEMIAAIKAKAPNAEILFVDYTTIFPREDIACEDRQPIDRKTVEAFVAQADTFAIKIESVMAKENVSLIKMSQASRNHHVCAEQPWVTGFEFNSDGVVPFHPKLEAMEHAAQLIVSALQ